MDLSAFQDSVFLQSLGGALLNSVWQAFILWILFEVISLYSRKASAAFRFNLSFFLLCLGFLWFLKDMVSLETLSSGGVVRSGVFSGEQGGGFPGAASFWYDILGYARPTLPFLSFAYMLLLFLLSVKLIAAYLHVYQISRQGLLAAPSVLEEFTTKVRIQMQIPKSIQLWISELIDIPATIGFFKPIILIPLASLNHLSMDQLEAIIIHELGHIKRNDYLVNIIISIIDTILFFNPFIALLIRTAKKERENCCDDKVLRYHDNPHGYALALLRLEQSRIHPVTWALGAVSGENQLLGRIKRITGGNVINRRFNYGQKLLALLGVTAIFCSLAWLNPQPRPDSSGKVGSMGKPSILAINHTQPLPVEQVLRPRAESANLPNTSHISSDSMALEPEQRILDDYKDSLAQSSIEEIAIQNPLTQEALNQISRAQTQTQIGHLDQTRQDLFNLIQNGVRIGISTVREMGLQNINIHLNPEQIPIQKINQEIDQAFQNLPSRIVISETEAQALKSFPAESLKYLRDLPSRIDLSQMEAKAMRNLPASTLKYLMDLKNANLQLKGDASRHDRIERLEKSSSPDLQLQRTQILIQDSLVHTQIVVFLRNSRDFQGVISQFKKKEDQSPHQHSGIKVQFQTIEQ